jgi:hypothetical protein
MLPKSSIRERGGWKWPEPSMTYKLNNPSLFATSVEAWYDGARADEISHGAHHSTPFDIRNVQ